MTQNGSNMYRKRIQNQRTTLYGSNQYAINNGYKHMTLSGSKIFDFKLYRSVISIAHGFNRDVIEKHKINLPHKSLNSEQSIQPRNELVNIR